MTKRRCAPALLMLLALTTPAVAEQNLPIKIAPSPNGQAITAGGTPFAEYRVDAGGKPVIWPLIGPNGFRMTRDWPLAPQADHESADHPHQIGLWFGHGEVNGIDFWHRPGPPGSKNPRGRVRHKAFVTAIGGDTGGTIITHNDWRDSAGQIICRDERKLRFGATPTRRWIDFSILLRPEEVPLRIGDTKEGAFALRIAGPLRTKAGLGGEIVNSQGKRNNEAWGAPAAWVDYHGRIEDQLLGVAILSHPSNFRPKPRWHVRGYGLFAANPFGEKEFPPVEDSQQGPITVNVGDDLQLRYRVVMHMGDEQQADIKGVYLDYGSL